MIALLPIDFLFAIFNGHTDLEADAGRLGDLRTSEVVIGIVIRVAGIAVDAVVDTILLNEFAHFEASEAVFCFSLR